MNSLCDWVEIELQSVMGEKLSLPKYLEDWNEYESLLRALEFGRKLKIVFYYYYNGLMSWILTLIDKTKDSFSPKQRLRYE